jgi:hypothetical protein
MTPRSRTPRSAIKFPKLIEYASSDYKKDCRGLKITVYQGTQPAPEAAENSVLSALQTIVPSACDVYAEGGKGATRLRIEGWRANIADLERFGNALLEIVAKGRAEGLFT